MRNKSIFFSLARFFGFCFYKVFLVFLRRYFWHIIAAVLVIVGMSYVSCFLFEFILKLISYLVACLFCSLKWVFLALYGACSHDPSAIILIVSFSYTLIAVASFFRFVDPKIILHFTSAASSIALYCCCWHLAMRNGFSLRLFQVLFAGIVLGTILTQSWMRITVDNEEQ